MLVFDFGTIGNKLLSIRKKAGLTQSEVAEKANLSDRTYADIERGTVNMRIETILKICEALHSRYGSYNGRSRYYGKAGRDIETA